MDEKQRTVVADRGRQRGGREEADRARAAARGRLLYDPTIGQPVHHVNQALRAHKLFQRDVDYIVKSDKVVIIDEFTGRMMEGRRYSDGLHQALEAKEGVTDPAREPDAGLDHLPELLPALREARRHDRHGPDRGRGVRRSTSSTWSRSRPTCRSCARTMTTRCSAPPSEKFKAIVAAIEDGARARPADPGRHHLDREVRAAGGAAEEAEDPAPTC